jgi:hypothetical protein
MIVNVNLLLTLQWGYRTRSAVKRYKAAAGSYMRLSAFADR